MGVIIAYYVFIIMEIRHYKERTEKDMQEKLPEREMKFNTWYKMVMKMYGSHDEEVDKLEEKKNTLLN